MGRMTVATEATEHNAGGFDALRPRGLVRGRGPRAFGILAIAVLIAGASYLGPGVRDAVFGPTTAPVRSLLAVPGQATTPDGRLPLADRIAFWTKRVQEQPSDDLSLLQLAAAYSEQGRLHVDLDAYARALEAANRALAISSGYPPGLATRASIEFSIHDFGAAEADASAALVHNPRDPIALAILGDSLLELGRTDEATAQYDAVATIAGGPSLDIRRARLAYVTGHPGEALDLARKALQGASGGPSGAETTDPIELAFYQDALGEYARLVGDADTARSAYLAALALRPDDLLSRIGLAKVAAADGDDVSAIRYLDAAAAIAPLPEVEALVGDLHSARGESAAAAVAHDTVRLTSTLSELAGSVYDRALILFELDHGGASDAILSRAREALAVRADYGGHDVVAWALHRLGRDDEAWAASQAARTGGIVDARILFHAGAIARARGDSAAGEALIRQALDLGPALDPADRAEATALLVRPGG